METERPKTSRRNKYLTIAVGAVVALSGYFGLVDHRLPEQYQLKPWIREHIPCLRQQDEELHRTYSERIKEKRDYTPEDVRP
ncbi:MAG: hypothetical protein ABIH92_01775 [Nanoarchaeota archaeon]